MSANRKAAEDFIIRCIGKLLPGKGSELSHNQLMYKGMFAAMNDKDFDEFMSQLEEGKVQLSIIAPNFTKPRLSIERNLALAEELGHNFFERIWIDNDDGTPPYLSTTPCFVVDLPLRRQAQLLVKKISIPEDNKSIDDYTGQPTGKSKGSKISYPEIQIMAAMDLDQCLVEMLKFRGGDIKGFNAMNTMISRTGGVSLKSIESLGTTVRSTDTLSTFLTSMHLSNTLSQ